MQGFEMELDALAGEDGELGHEAAFESESAFDEVEEMELAGALLEIQSEEELDQFLGNLIRRAGRAVGAAVRSPVGQTLNGILKNAARQALPVVGSAIGSAVGGPSGARAGSQLAATAGRLFGLELEGLTQEDREYEVARRFVRFAGAAAANAGRAPASGAPQAIASSAAAAAARAHAPGLLRPAGADAAARTNGAPRQGRWVRRGRHIVILNCMAPGGAR
jgi:hypothetical protein